MIMAIVLIGWLWWTIYLPVESNADSTVEIIINKGDGLSRIATALDDKDLIKNRTIFILYVTALGEDDNLKAGRYLFSKSMSMHHISKALAEGLAESDDIEITILEGSNVWEIDEILVKKELISESQFSKLYYKDDGYLFPDTYRITDNQRLTTNNRSGKIIKELREKMGKDFAEKVAPALSSKTPKGQKEILIIASILEKEAKSEEDMRLVSGIIRKRLEVGIPLQIDATVAYGTCLRTYNLRFTTRNLKNCDVTQIGIAGEIKIDGAYNTYIRKSLPLGPISSPGLKAINAALNPQKSDYLYYLSTRDGSRIIYSKTSAEHEANRRKYLGI